MASLTTEVLKDSGQIQTLNTAFVFTSTPVDSTTFAAQIKWHSETLDRLREENRGRR